MGKPEEIAAEKAVFAFEARIQGGEFEGLDPNGDEARNALKAEIRRAILSAVEEENEACAVEADKIAAGRDRQALEAKEHGEKAAARDFESMAISAGDVASAIRNRKGA